MFSWQCQTLPTTLLNPSDALDVSLLLLHISELGPVEFTSPVEALEALEAQS